MGGDPATVPPTHYCVVWERVFDAGVDNDIHARFVNANSTLVGGSTILVDNTFDTLDRNPSVSKSDGLAPFGTQRYTIVWQRRFEVGDEDIRAAQYLWDGSLVNASFSVDFSSTTHQFPTVSSVLDATSGERDYMIVYTAGDAGSQSLVGRIMNGDTSQAAANLTTLGGFTSGQNQILPSADSNGRSYAVAASELFEDSTTDYDVYISSFCRSGAAIRLAEGLQNLAFSVTTESQAQVCATHSGGLQSQEYYTVWRDAANVAAATLGDIESGRYDGLINDNEVCSDALPVGTGTFFGSLRCAVDNGASTCGLSDANPDVWYSFTAASHGTVTFTTCGTHDAPGLDDGMDTVLTLRNGCLLGSIQLTCNDDAIGDPCGGLDNGLIRDSLLARNMLAGDTVFLRVSHFDTAIANGEFRLNVAYATDPCAADFNNDGFINGIDLGILLNAFSIPPASPGCDGAAICLPDLNGDGLVNGVDLGILLVNFSVPPGTPCD